MKTELTKVVNPATLVTVPAWSVHFAIRSRREHLGLSQSDVASRLGVTKSLLSHIEGGSRQASIEQIGKLADVLNLPPNLLLMGFGYLPEDVQRIFNANAAEGVAAIRQQTENSPIAYPSTPQELPLPKLKTSGKAAIIKISERISVAKTATSYRAHSYHTKVPPEAIVPFISAFTRPGDVILDCFCGSGMTGVAALTQNRNALLSDVSVAAVHISRNYTEFCDPSLFVAALKAAEALVKPTMDWLYRPVGSHQDHLVEYTTWSDVYGCPKCRGEIVYWDALHAGEIDGDRLKCSSCKGSFRKVELQWLRETPVESHTSSKGSHINAHVPTSEELALISDATGAPIPYWVPAAAFGPEREMWRASHRSMGIASVSQFFTRRNLHALAALRHAIVRGSEGRAREALMFAFTACVNRASRRYQWNAKRPTNVMTGTLYISSLRYEWNVWSLFRRKAADVMRYYEQFPKTKAQVQVFQRSATDLDCLPDHSVDMVFIDPPFGSNIYYADSSLLWEAWLGTLTDENTEIVVNQKRAPEVGGKSLDDYSTLMQQAFAHCARVLKPGGSAVLAFSNTNDQVWEAVRRALEGAGLKTMSVHILDKGQPSIKGVKGLAGKENVTCLDLILCLKSKRTSQQMSVKFPPPAPFVQQAIFDDLSAGERRTDELYSSVIRAAVASNYSISGITMPVVAEYCRALSLTQTPRGWCRSHQHDHSTTPQDFIAGYLTSPESLPRSRSTRPPKDPISLLQVSGGRNSAFYLAHSYHTKVPPEAIAPFIEHYTNPGDVVLDPFCGSGMTGVAAALAGRRAILNDLSPAAIHLAWNHTRPCDPEALSTAFRALEERLEDEVAELYRTTHADGTTGIAQWVLWSSKHLCQFCSAEFLLWDAIDRESGRIGNTICCPKCKRELRRSTMRPIGSQPAWITYETEDKKRHEKRATAEDIRRALQFQRDAITDWFPTTAMGPEREMFIRCALHLQGVKSVADFYTARNLRALAAIWREILLVPDVRVRRVLAFAFTNTAWHGTRMRRFNARGGQRPLTGTLYIPQLSSEVNVLSVMRHKIKQLGRYYRDYQPRAKELPAVVLGSASDLAGVATGSVDYVFTDPPFGSNIFYADCNLIWESWLGRLTSTDKEAVVNRSLSNGNGGKTLEFYGRVMGAAMLEMARVLKPGGWATIVFHNTDAAVWKSIRDAAIAAGFEFHEASSLNRKQHSHKGYKGRAGAEDVAHFDVVFNLRRSRKSDRVLASSSNNDERDLKAFVASIAREKLIVARGLQGLHSEVMRRLASSGSARFVDYAVVRSVWEELIGKSKPVAAAID